MIVKLKAIFKKDFMLALSYKSSFILEFGSIFFTIAIVFLVSDFIDTNQASDELNLSNNYFNFVIWGICLTEIMTKVVGACSRDVLSYKNTGILEELFLLPSSELIILIGSHIYPIFISILKLTISLLFASFLVNEPLMNMNYFFPFLVTLLTLLSSLVFISLIGAAYTFLFFKISLIPLAYISCSIFFGEAYFPIELLPKSFEIFTYFFTIGPALENFRMISSNEIDYEVFGGNILHICVLSIIYGFVSILSIRYSINHAKKNGTTLHY